MEQLTKYLAQNFKDAFLVGGCVRDAYLNRPSGDIDIALPQDSLKSRCLALSKNFGGSFFPLDEQHGVYRIVFKNFNNLQIDFAAMQGENIKEDVLKRDFTLNALAYSVNAPFKIETANDEKIKLTLLSKTETADFTGGVKDLNNKLVKHVTPSAFTEDPLRLLRLFRIAYELGFKISPASKKLVKKYSRLITTVSGERINEEFMRILSCDGVAAHLKELYACGLLTALFPELEKQKNCAEEYYGKGGVLKHTFIVCDRLEYLLNNLNVVFPGHPQLESFKAKAALLKFTALMHDIAKPKTAKLMDGRLRFFHHDTKGAKMTAEIMRSLRFSNSDIELANLVIAEHLRAGNLAANRVITDKSVYRFLRQNQKAAVPLLLVCWADHTSYISYKQIAKILPLASLTPSVNVPKEMPRQGVEKTLKHLQVISLMLKLYFSRPEKINPGNLLNGSEVMNLLGIPAGPAVGKALNKLKLAQVDGKVNTKEEAQSFILKLKNLA